MIDPKYTQRLYDALNLLLEETCPLDVQEVGGQPLQDAWDEADKLQREIDQRPTIEDALSAAIDFVSGCQSEELLSMLTDTLDSLRGEKPKRETKNEEDEILYEFC